MHFDSRAISASTIGFIYSSPCSKKAAAVQRYSDSRAVAYRYGFPDLDQPFGILQIAADKLAITIVRALLHIEA